jgi:diguanylate cyclase
MSDESKKYISVIFKEWLPLYDGLTPEVKAILKILPLSSLKLWPLVFMTSFFRIPISPAT